MEKSNLVSADRISSLDKRLAVVETRLEVIMWVLRSIATGVIGVLISLLVQK